MELNTAETYWLILCQSDHFSIETNALSSGKNMPPSSCLLPYHPFLDSSSVLQVGGREQNSNAAYSSLHPIILHGKHPLAKLIVHSEHIRLLHAGPRLLASMLSCRFYIVGHGKKLEVVSLAEKLP